MSVQAGLQVKVINNSGLPYVLTYVIASCVYSCMCLGLPENVAGNMTKAPRFSTLQSFATALLR
jgi:hypothetical protein